MSQAMAAVAIDMILPSFPEVRAHLGLAADSPRVSLLITAFMLGSGVAQLPVGILADRFGRRPVMWCGLTLYVLAAVGATQMRTLSAMIACRFLWGMAAAAPRVVAVSMARDRFQGRRMAQTLSYVHTVFVIVPIVAPSGGILLLHAGGWRWAMAAPALTATILAVWLIRIPETLAKQDRRLISPKVVGSALGTIRRTRRTVLLTGTLVCSTALISSYVGLAELITDQTYNRKAQFPIIFGVVAFAMAAGGLVNANLVGRFGTMRMLSITPVAMLGITTTFALSTIAWNGKPPFLFYCGAMGLMLLVQTLIFPNANGAALQPLGHVAGLASGVIGTVSTVLGATVAIFIVQMHRGDVTVLAIGLALLAAVSTLLSRAAARTEAGPPSSLGVSAAAPDAVPVR